MPETYTVDDLAQALKAQPETVCKWARNGSLPGAFKIGRSWRFRRADIDRLLGSQPERMKV